LDYKGVIRCVQASSGFFTEDKERNTPVAESKTCRLPITLRTLLSWDTRRGILTETSPTGKRLVSVVRLQTSFATMLQGRVNFAIRHNTALPAAVTLTLGQFTLANIKYEHRKNSGLGFIPSSSDAHHGELACSGRPHFARYGNLATR